MFLWHKKTNTLPHPLTPFYQLLPSSWGSSFRPTWKGWLPIVFELKLFPLKIVGYSSLALLAFKCIKTNSSQQWDSRCHPICLYLLYLKSYCFNHSATTAGPPIFVTSFINVLFWTHQRKLSWPGIRSYQLVPYKFHRRIVENLYAVWIKIVKA